MLLFVLQTKNVILQKNATLNVLFNLKKTKQAKKQAIVEITLEIYKRQFN